jgi:hypothetical protein
MTRASRIAPLLGAVLAAGLAGCSQDKPQATAVPPAAAVPSATPPASCAPGAIAEDTQGRVTPGHVDGYHCNTELVWSYEIPEDQIGNHGGFKVERYLDAAGRECAFYDTTLLFPTNVFGAEAGVNVFHMNHPDGPTQTARLVTPAMATPHETLVLNPARGLLVAIGSTLATGPGQVDVYDVSQDCTQPALKFSGPSGILGHESGMALDGNTVYAASFYSPDQDDGAAVLTAVDISNPALPRPLSVLRMRSHGLSLSADGTRAYVAGAGDHKGLVIIDTSEVQGRTSANQQMKILKYFDWRPLGEPMSTPQNALPVTIKGHPYLLAFDEFGAQSQVGGVHIIDIADEMNPKIVANIRLAVHQPENFEAQARDPGATTPFQGYAAHYCNVPQRDEPGILACSMILSGLRVFDIREPGQPREVAYFNAPVRPRRTTQEFEASNWAMSSPAFAPERNEIWYTDAFQGFYVVKVAAEAWPKP